MPRYCTERAQVRVARTPGQFAISALAGVEKEPEAPQAPSVDKAPALSVVVIAFNKTPLLEGCLQSLERQSVRAGIEVLVVMSRRSPNAGLEVLKRRYRDARWICDSRQRSVPQLRSQGIAHSRGQIIAFLEDDCVADERWCAALLAAHQHRHGAIGGAVEPGDYMSPLDWAVYFFEYARFMRPMPKGEARALPGTNVSYKRRALLDLMPQTWADGFYEFFVHSAFLRAGIPMALDPAAVVYNVNSWQLFGILKDQFYFGRVFAGIRGVKQPLLARLRFLAIATILPVIQLIRIGKEVIGKRRHVWRAGVALPWIILLSLSWSIGEFVGYLQPSDRLVEGQAR